MYPLTLQRAKPAVGFAGKYRLIDIPISNCINSNIKRMFLLTQFMSASLHRHIMQTYQFSTFSDGFVDILAAEQTPKTSSWFQGTADAVRATLNHTTYYESDQMLILSGDHLYRMNYADLINFHRENKADVTVGVYPASRKEAPRMGLLKADTTGLVKEFVEKPKDSKVIKRFKATKGLLKSHGLEPDSDYYLASMGIYVFEPDVLLKMLSNESWTDFGREIIPEAIKNFRVTAYPFAGYWRDIGTIDAFFDANINLLQSNPPFPLYKPGWPIYTRTRLLPPSCVMQTEIRDSLLVEGSYITGAFIKDSIVGMRGIVRKNARLNKVVMLGADFYEGEQLLTASEGSGKNLPDLGIGRDCVIERTIIDKNARIGKGVVIKVKPGREDFQSENYWIRDGITIIPKGVVIPAGTVIR
jgi:glucose-1-phosphate adenylyltransferase